MNTHVKSRFLRLRTLLFAAPLLIALWWAFRPEKLFLNEAVSEGAPAAIAGEPRPEFTGRFLANAHPTSGRATIYRSAEGKEYVRLSDFSTSNGPDVHVVLASADDAVLTQKLVATDLDAVELGSLKANQGTQNYDLPAKADLYKYQAVVIYCERFHEIFGVARLEQF